MLKSACRCISNFAAYSPRHHHRKKRDWRGEKVWSDLIMAEKGKVCVTGAGGYVASWVVKLLLSKGYIVHGTVREPMLLQVELMEPAVKGTLNVLKACTEAKVKRVVVVSSGSAVMRNPRWPKGKVKDETCWSDKEYCRTTENWYCLSKTEAETEALEYAKKSGLDVVRVCPTLVLGPILQSTINASSLVLIKLLKEGYESLENKHRMIVDARDVAEALLLAYEQPEAEGRYICTAHMIKMQDLVENLRSIYPYYNYPKNFTEGEETENLSSEKLQRLGWNYRPLEETLVDSIKSYKEAGILD
ncbi:cinnamoyl-CoA reductase 2-like isoform X2 [Vitis riparia]|uniref:cinnamoyl-CoA reductase 2-like isoform X2 n=1 Tax=Vitis riparia TaxID=96939 RepID=UPI00155A723A|nr:cinnamoyl-CoA reductase 2-like isoform X2 [Vitis riparia]